MPSRVLTVMFSDVKGFTERTSKSSRTELKNLLQEHETLLLPVVERFGGRLVKTFGDALMVVFESPTNAVLCGVMMQERLRERNEKAPPTDRLEVRVAINTGEVVEREGDVFGEAVNVASRIEGITDAGEVYFAESVYLAMNKAEVPSSEVGLRRLKGVPEAIRVYRVIQDRNANDYQRLLERLRSDAFADVPVPTTGEAAAKPKTRVRWIPVAVLAGAAATAGLVTLGVIVGRSRSPSPRDEPSATDLVPGAAAGVAEAIESGELGLALARADTMLREHPTRKESHEALRAAVEAEAGALAQKERYEEALELLDEREGSQGYVKFGALRKELRLKHAHRWAERGNYRVAGPVYTALLREHSEDIEVLRAVVADTGPGSKMGGRSLAEAAARKLAALTEGPLEDPLGDILIASLDHYHPAHERALEARKLLARRHPPAAEKVRKMLADEDRNARMNAFFFLKEQGLLTPGDELAVHVKNLVTLKVTDSFDRKYLQLSLDCLEEACSRPGWEDRKKTLALGRITKVVALGSSGDTVKRVSGLLVRAFLPEVRRSLTEWMTGKDLVLRARAFAMLRDAGLEGEIDVWAYHAGNLMLDDYGYQYECLHEAVAYFRDQASTPRAGEARALLQEAREAIAKKQKERESLGLGGRRRNYEANLKALDGALGAFE